MDGLAVDPEIHRLTADEYHRRVEVVSELTAPHLGLAPVAVADALASAR